MIYYIRDDEGRLVGFKYNNTKYYYIKNLQDDIIGIMDSSFNTIVNYEYDSWGKVISIKDNNGSIITDTSHIGIINPYRYRSYYYDNETGYYYLNSRYYNPEWGRFINADGIIKAEENKYNLYIYCKNNPIKYVDYSGKNAAVLGGALDGLAGGGALSVAGEVLASFFPVVAIVVGVATLMHVSAEIESRQNKDKTGDYYVYGLMDCSKSGTYKGCKVEYVGRTGNLKSAEIRHRANPYRSHLELNKLDDPMSYERSRVREQYFIKFYRTLNRYDGNGHHNKMHNQINGLSPSKYEKYKHIIDEMGDDLTYVGGSLW